MPLPQPWRCREGRRPRLWGPVAPLSFPMPAEERDRQQGEPGRKGAPVSDRCLEQVQRSAAELRGAGLTARRPSHRQVLLKCSRQVPPHHRALRYGFCLAKGPDSPGIKYAKPSEQGK